MQKTTKLTLAAKYWKILQNFLTYTIENLKAITNCKLRITFCCEHLDALENTIKITY